MLYLLDEQHLPCRMFGRIRPVRRLWAGCPIPVDLGSAPAVGYRALRCALLAGNAAEITRQATVLRLFRSRDNGENPRIVDYFLQGTRLTQARFFVCFYVTDGV